MRACLLGLGSPWGPPSAIGSKWEGSGELTLGQAWRWHVVVQKGFLQFSSSVTQLRTVGRLVLLFLDSSLFWGCNSCFIDSVLMISSEITYWTC